MLKILYAGCLGLSPAISVQFTLKMCVGCQNGEKFTKASFLGGSSSCKIIDVDKFKKPMTYACYDTQHVCTYLQPFFPLYEPIMAKYRFFRKSTPF